MTDQSKSTKKGTLIASIGGLFTVFSLTIFEDKNMQLISALARVVLAFYGLILIQKSKKKV